MREVEHRRWSALAADTVRIVFERSPAKFEGIGVDSVELLEATVSRTLERFRRAGREPDELAFRDAVGRAALEDLGLVLAWQRGDEGAWQLYESEFKRAVISAAQRQGATLSRATELADELPGTLLAATSEGASSALLRYDGSGSLRGWLCAIVRRRVIDAVRREQRIEELEEDRMTSTASDPEMSAERSELRERVRSSAAGLRASLTSRERLALLLKHEQGLSQRSIASRLGVSDSRVTRLVQNATDKLRDHFAQSLGGQLPDDEQLPHELLRALGSASTDERPSTPSNADPNTEEAS